MQLASAMVSSPTQLSALQLRVGRDYRLSAEAVRRAITRNTVLVVASAPGFPHGVIDHVADIAAVRALKIHDALLVIFAHESGFRKRTQQKTRRALITSVLSSPWCACCKPNETLLVCCANTSEFRKGAKEM